MSRFKLSALSAQPHIVRHKQVSKRYEGASSIQDIALAGADKLVRLTILSVEGIGGCMFGGVRGTCAIMERIAIEIGEDLMPWLSTTLRTTPRGQ